MDLIPIAFIVTMAAFVLLMLVIVSVPFVSTFYFLHSTIAGGVKYGLWGWCTDDGRFCDGPHLGYVWDPNIITWLTKALVLYPIGAAFTCLAALAVVPLFFYTGHRHFPSPFFSAFILISFVCTILAWIFTVALVVVARNRFHKQGFEATLGPAFWMALTATVLILLMVLNTGCGSMCRGRFGRASSHIAYNL